VRYAGERDVAVMVHNVSSGVSDPHPWWRAGVIYQIYPRSFADSTGDGVGDLNGIRAHLDHLRWLGVDGIWLSPVYRSPMDDFGYDISDHCAIDPVFGTLADMDALIAEAHGSDIKVMLDWVPNHTSDQHPWFLESRSSRTSPKRDWYFWRDGADPSAGPEGDRPNNWLSAFGGPAWTWDDATTQWYLHLFLRQQPDLNWSNLEVEQAQHDVLRFWLDRGVDGFRADVIHLLGKDEHLPDREADDPMVGLVGTYDNPRTHDLLRRIRQVLDSYPGSRPMVGEVNLGSADLIAPYYGHGDELHMVFNFSLLREPWDPMRWADRIVDAERALLSRGAWPTWVLSNHDVKRQRSRYGGSEARARVAAMVLLTLRGTPFLYAGEELGAQNARIEEHQRLDPGYRDGCRSPIAWTADRGHGWPEDTWLPLEANADEANAESLRADETSILWLYRRLLAARRASAALHSGSWELDHVDQTVLDYRRVADSDTRRVVANFGADPVERPIGDWAVELDSDQAASRPWDGIVPGETAVILRPRT
jgi:alpha-glucosidase